MIKKEQVRRLLHNELNALAESGFALAKRIPSTHSRNIVRFISTLGRLEREILFEFLVERGLDLLFRDSIPKSQTEPGDPPVITCYYDAARQVSFGARLLRMALAVNRTEPGTYPDELIREAESIHPTSATQIRKVIKAVFKDRFDGRAENSRGGDWIYRCRLNDRLFTVSMDFGGQIDQLRYNVKYEDSDSGLQSWYLTYEVLVGMGDGCWDYVTADNLIESVNLLADLVERLVTIPDRLDGPAVGEVTVK